MRDHEPDVKAGGRMLVARFGRAFGVLEYAALWAVALPVPVALAVSLRAPRMLLPQLTLPGAMRLTKAVSGTRGRALNPLLGAPARGAAFFAPRRMSRIPCWEAPVQLTGYVIEGDALSWCGSGDEGRFEALAESHAEALTACERRHELPAGAAEDALRAWVMDGRGAGAVGRCVLDAVLADDPRCRLEDNAWSPVRGDALDELDAALKAHGLPRNASLAKLAPLPLGSAGRPLALEDAALRLLPGQRYVAVETAWPPVVARLTGDVAARARALLAWWTQTRTRHVDAAIRGRRADFDVLLVLA